MRWLTVFNQDVRFQYRHGFYLAYFFVTLIYVALLFVVPEEYKRRVAVLIVFSDPAALGFFFIGGIVLLERGQRIIRHLRVTPLRLHEYLWGKWGSLAVLSLMSSFMIKGIVFGTAFNPVPLFLGVLFSAIFFTLLGVVLALRVQTVNQFLFASPIIIVPFYLPALGYLERGDHFLFHFIPGAASIRLIDGAFHPLSGEEWGYALGLLLIWIAAAYIVSYKSLAHHWIKEKGGIR